MGPPQVELSKKQPLEDVQGWAEVVGDGKMPDLPPKVDVAVESRTTVLGRRTVLAKRRCKKLIIGIVIGAVIATLITVGAFLIHRRHHGDHWKGHVKDKDGHQAEEEYRTDGHRHLLHIARNDTNHFFRLLAVLDYDTQLAGFKDCGRQLCYVDRLRESYEEGCQRWRHYQKHDRLLTERPLRVGPLIPRDVLQYIGGAAIFRVCGHLPSHWVLELPEPLAEGDNTTEIIYL
eukprot:TRINITY_DN191510_c0_g1_i1.p1 TRINITY_DN191510_c0_g1~~TRINITY_DN191510_c0_g1_i1.p1  ORF type:complete len:232 (-),score=62.59 TRINITY_DN191510_c0_g1_i1:230-925(-)